PAGRDVLGLGLGQSPFPVPEPVVQELRDNAHRKDYLAVRGLLELREAIAAYHADRQGIARTAENVIVGPGSKELLFLLQLVYDGDLLIPSPSWVSYAPQARIIGKPVHWLPTRAESGWKVVADELESLCAREPHRPRLLILNYPSNPTGLTHDVAELQAIAAVAARHRIAIVADEIYGELHHRGEHVSIARFHPEGTIVSGGLSKWCGAGGWRLGTLSFPAQFDWLREALVAVASETYTATSAPIQYAAVRAFRLGEEIEDYLHRARRILGSLGRRLANRLRTDDIEVPDPQGGFYLFVDFERHRERLAARGIRTAAAMCESLLTEAGVAILPGSDFGRPDTELTARIAYVNFDGEAALEGARGVAGHEPLDLAFLTQYCERTLSAIDRVCAWIAPEDVEGEAPLLPLGEVQ
ncbi:MAG: aminotransferase class I/II-fold pyridoxal phosphate-dependent enzyme, partial [Planctomycetaceae bacterium]